MVYVQNKLFWAQKIFWTLPLNAPIATGLAQSNSYT